MTAFERFVAIDWTGAKGVRHRAIAVAACGIEGPPVLLRPGHRWARTEVAALIEALAGTRTLVGIDASFSLPFADAGGFFPGDADSPADARALWADVEAVCAGEDDLRALSYVARRRRHFWLGSADGPRGPAARLRACEVAHRARGRGQPSSCFVLLGAAQCGKASLSAMRLLRGTRLPVWPFDPVPARGACLVEIYCQHFASDGGVRGKIRDAQTLNRALATLGSPAAEVPDRFDDHVGDALVSAAGMRAAAADGAVWRPAGLSAAVAMSEGWTFGIV
ncbi:hypothetical protein [Sandaracinobacteroides saxicola]|uniref:DUF429 domain-containing protein n=1 Tax=Sandaracinobacteroides saxicola TaxID=2759707 RepID=A0A7G5IFM4_9SPHN|nr:hypothetical protein [Sandaracinobacteroides saxicola]QMW22166.1 hypothetical protein H3309_12425 [Sandaracinobacteroides saxicola]